MPCANNVASSCTLPITVLPLFTSIVSPTSARVLSNSTWNTGRVTLVRLSVLLIPLSEAAFRSIVTALLALIRVSMSLAVIVTAEPASGVRVIVALPSTPEADVNFSPANTALTSLTLPINWIPFAAFASASTKPAVAVELSCPLVEANVKLT